MASPRKNSSSIVMGNSFSAPRDPEADQLVKHDEVKESKEQKQSKEVTVAFQKMTPNQELRYFVTKGDEEKIRELVQAGADVNAYDEGEKMEDVNKNTQVVEKVAPKITHDYPLHLAASSNQIKVISQLFFLGARMENKNRVGSTPLHRAVSSGHEEAVAELIKLGADVCAKNSMGQTPLHIAAMLNNLSIVKLLIEKGAEADLRTLNFVKLTPIEYTLPQSSVREYLLSIKPDLIDLVKGDEPVDNADGEMKGGVEEEKNNQHA